MIPSLLALLLIPAPALAGDLDVGLNLGVGMDLSDPASTDAQGKAHTRFGPGPSLKIPVRYRVAPNALLRATARFDLATGSDRVTWLREVDGEPVRIYDDEHFSMLIAGALTVGGDVELPIEGPVKPFFGSDLGAAWVGTYHSLGGPTQPLLDPEQNDLDNPKNVDPYTTQLAFLTEFHAGVGYELSEGLAVGLETGYSIAFLDDRELRKAPEELSARREAYGWNAFRVGLGFTLGL